MIQEPTRAAVHMTLRQKRSISLPPDLARAVDEAAKAERATFGISKNTRRGKRVRAAGGEP